MNITLKFYRNHTIQKTDFYSKLNSMCKDMSYIFVFVKIRDIKQIDILYPDNLKIISKLKDIWYNKIVIDWNKYGVNDLIDLITPIPRKSKLEFKYFYTIDPVVFDLTINELWKIIIEFENPTFLWKCGKPIKILGILGKYDDKDSSKNLFKIEVDGSIGVTTINILSILLNN